MAKNIVLNRWITQIAHNDELKRIDMQTDKQCMEKKDAEKDRERRRQRGGQGKQECNSNNAKNASIVHFHVGQSNFSLWECGKHSWIVNFCSQFVVFFFFVLFGWHILNVYFILVNQVKITISGTVYHFLEVKHGVIVLRYSLPF